jgi:starch phosphorylase
MVGHTLRALGPRVQASRMVREYVEELYVPAAQASRALSEGAVLVRTGLVSTGPASTISASTGRTEPFAAARELAAWKRRVTRAWGGVRIEHVEGEDGDQGPGGSLVVRATVALGGLSPDDVSVEVVYGRVGDADEILNPAVSPLTIEDGPEDGVARFVGKAELGRPGPFGYTLRVVPRHPLLAGAAEMGLITLPEAPAGLTTGDLR